MHTLGRPHRGRARCASLETSVLRLPPCPVLPLPAEPAPEVVECVELALRALQRCPYNTQLHNWTRMVRCGVCLALTPRCLPGRWDPNAAPCLPLPAGARRGADPPPGRPADPVWGQHQERRHRAAGGRGWEGQGGAAQRLQGGARSPRCSSAALWAQLLLTLTSPPPSHHRRLGTASTRRRGRRSRGASSGRHRRRHRRRLKRRLTRHCCSRARWRPRRWRWRSAGGASPHWAPAAAPTTCGRGRLRRPYPRLRAARRRPPRRGRARL